MNTNSFDNCSPWVRRFSQSIVPGGRVLDLACGEGRHSRFLVAQGYRVEAVDANAEVMATGLNGVAGVNTKVADLETGPWPYFGFTFDGIIVTNYLHRALLPQVLSAVGEGGVLIYETFMMGNERFGSPSNPNFLLRQGELLDMVRKRLTVLAFEQGEVSSPRPAMVQRICAVRGNVVKVPEFTF